VPAIVLDASVPLGALLPGEAYAAGAVALLTRVSTDGAVVPVIWWIEIANGVLMAERRQRFGPDEAAGALRHLETLPIETDSETNAHAWSATLGLARRHRLSLYDACYLELALRRKLPLASFDAALLRAAAAEGVATA
jgi:predicted nucleic acid-binding protein